MKLKVGDVVEFKKYEDTTDDERMMIDKNHFPLSGKVKEINVNDCDRCFCIAGSKLIFHKGSVARVISDGVDINSLNSGDEVLAKVTVKKVFNGFIQINPSVDKTDVIDILKRKEPEHFIVQDNYYGMYIGRERELVRNNSKAKIYTSRDAADNDAVNMYLKSWNVIPYVD